MYGFPFLCNIGRFLYFECSSAVLIMKDPLSDIVMVACSPMPLASACLCTLLRHQSTSDC